MKLIAICSLLLWTVAFGQANCARQAMQNSDSLYVKRRETLFKFCDMINKGAKDTAELKKVLITSKSSVDSLRNLSWALVFEQMDAFKQEGFIDTTKLKMENYQTSEEKERFYAFYSDPETLRNTYSVTFPTGFNKFFLFRGEKIFSFRVLKMGNKYFFMGF